MVTKEHFGYQRTFQIRNASDLEYYDHDYDDHGHLLQGSGRHGEPAKRHSVKEEGSPSKLYPWILAKQQTS